MPESLRMKWQSKQVADTLLVFMKYWELSHKELLDIPIPSYIRMMEFMEKDLKEQKKQSKKAKKKK